MRKIKNVIFSREVALRMFSDIMIICSLRIFFILTLSLLLPSFLKFFFLILNFISSSGVVVVFMMMILNSHSLYIMYMLEITKIWRIRRKVLVDDVEMVWFGCCAKKERKIWLIVYVSEGLTARRCDGSERKKNSKKFHYFQLNWLWL